MLQRSVSIKKYVNKEVCEQLPTMLYPTHLAYVVSTLALYVVLHVALSLL